MKQSHSSHYTFGDSDFAALRLEYLARAYANSSTAFLRSALPARVDRAVDLGCGLGFTTAMLHRLTEAPQVIGYERSSAFIERARASLPHIEFRQLDVLMPPYPDRDVDLFYSRFLLTHLHDPEKLLAACVQHLKPGGHLLLEETFELTSPLPCFQRYYALVDELQAHHGQQLRIGQRLPTMIHELRGCRSVFETQSLQLPARVMAKLHAMNIATWKHEAHMLAAHGVAALERLEAELNALVELEGELPSVTSVMMQAVVERSD